MPVNPYDSPEHLDEESRGSLWVLVGVIFGAAVIGYSTYQILLLGA